MATFSNNLVAKSGNKTYFCESCDYTCCKKYNWEKHLLTAKHMNFATFNQMATEKGQKGQIHSFCCEICNKEYKDRSGLWRHKSKCAKPNQDLIDYLIKENKEIKDLVLELIKKDTYNNCTISTNNSHNKAFNLQFFLNETCKNAMNITDFIDSIKLQLSDLMEVGEHGYIAGISNIIVKNLNNLHETERPIHCTDKKRETFYVKDEGQWEKDDEERKKVKRVIRSVACKNQRLLMKYKEEHPGCNYSESKYCDEYSKLVIEAMGGRGNDEKEKEDKIIRNISMATTINQKL